MRVGRLVLGALVGVLGSVAGVLGASGSPVFAATGSSLPLHGYFVSTTSGPVGTEVRIAVNAGPACYHSTNFGGVYFTTAAPRGPFDGFPPQPSSSGLWTATFVVPPFVGSDATNGGYGGRVVPGTWLLQLQTACSSNPRDNYAIIPFEVTSAKMPGSHFTGIAPLPDGKGYWLVQANGGVYSFGDARFYGSLPGIGVSPHSSVTGIAATPDGKGYWLVSANGGVYSFGDARFYGSLPGIGVSPFGPITDIVPTSNGQGYWLLGADGGVFSFGDAGFYGSGLDGFLGGAISLLPGPDDHGYLMAFAEGPGRVYSFGDAPSFPIAGGPTPSLLAGAAATPGDQGYWQVGADGGVYSFGDARFYGSLPGIGVSPAGPVVGIAATPNGQGYWLVSAGGGVYALGDAGFYGSAA